MVFTSDWLSHNLPFWDSVLPKTPGQHILEIGSYEGRSCVWFCENIPDSKITCIDTFEGSDENSIEEKEGLYMRFKENTDKFSHRIQVKRGYSYEVLRTMSPSASYDIVYIDGSHYTADVLSDAILTFPMVKVGGYIIFDDFEWPCHTGTLKNPRIGIESFVNCHMDKLKIVSVAYQLIVKKIN
jgi:predicted O-methyltransferase YrrM